MWIFIAMFALPEILFFTIPSSIINYSGKNFLTLSSLFVDSQFFINNPRYFFADLIIELIAILGLLMISIKSGKKVSSLFLGIILLWLFFVSLLAYLSISVSIVV